MRIPAALSLVLSLMISASALVRLAPSAPESPTALLPSGALLVLEARDFSGLLSDWQQSREKQIWLASDNYRVFSRSRLFLRLQEARREFAAAAGFQPNAALAEAVAGQRAALALYSIGDLEFLYVAEVPRARAVESVLWQMRGQFETRQAAGQRYFVRTDPKSNRVVAFALTERHFFLATREGLLAESLALLAGQEGAAVRADRWYGQAVGLSGSPGDVRLVMNFEAIARTSYFRAYWVQRNVSELSNYVAAISDLHLSREGIREERLLLRSLEDSTASAPGQQAGTTPLAELLPLVSENSGFYRGWEDPSVEETLEILREKILAPSADTKPAKEPAAPRVQLLKGTVGSAGQLETRIDQEPVRITSATFLAGQLRALLERADVQALLHVESTRYLPDGVFLEPESAVVLRAARDWDEKAVRDALQSSVENLWTTSQIGLGWVEKEDATGPYWELDGLAPLAVAVRGPLLVVTDRSNALLSVLGRVGGSSGRSESGGVTYASGFRHGRERESFLQLMRMLDHPWISSYGQNREPRFFSENLGSLSETLVRIDEASILVRDRGSVVSQTVLYRLEP